MSDLLDRHDKMQRLNRRSPLGEWDKAPSESYLLESVTLIGIGIVIGMGMLAGMRALDAPSVKGKAKLDCAGCHQKMAYVDYFKRAGNRTPDQMAEAVTKTKSPRLLAAIATRGEKNTPHTVRKGGYKNEHAGAWQVNERLHGAVSTDPSEQARQAEQLLVDLILGEKDIVTVLNIYGGESDRRNGQYAKDVLDEFRRVP